MIEISKIIGLVIFSALKFFIAPAATVFAGYNFFTSLLITSSGGILGFFIFFKFGTFIKQTIEKFLNPKAKPKPRFTYRNRIIVRVKRKYGFYGLAVLTPCLFGMPLGALIASVYFGKQQKTIPVFAGFIVLWSFVLTSISIYIKEI